MTKNQTLPRKLALRRDLIAYVSAASHDLEPVDVMGRLGFEHMSFDFSAGDESSICLVAHTGADDESVHRAQVEFDALRAIRLEAGQSTLVFARPTSSGWMLACESGLTSAPNIAVALDKASRL